MFQNLIARLRATPPWVWITIAIAAAGLVISFLIYRNSQSGSASSGSTSTGPVNPGDTTGGYSPYGNNSSQYQPDYATQSYLQEIVNLLKGIQPGGGSSTSTGATSGGSIVGTTTPAGQTIVGVGPSVINETTPRTTQVAPTLAPHPVLMPTPTAAPAARANAAPVIGSVAHADVHRGTLPHPGAVSIGSYNQFRQNAR